MRRTTASSCASQPSQISRVFAVARLQANWGVLSISLESVDVESVSGDAVYLAFGRRPPRAHHCHAGLRRRFDPTPLEGAAEFRDIGPSEPRGLVCRNPTIYPDSCDSRYESLARSAIASISRAIRAPRDNAPLHVLSSRTTLIDVCPTTAQSRYGR